MNLHSHQLTSRRAWLPFSILAGLLLFSGACATVNSGEKKLLAQKKFEEAQGASHLKHEKYKILKEAILLAPKEPMYRVALGNAYFKNLELDKAERMYLSAVKVGPEFVGTYRQLGRLYVQKSKWDNAIFYLNRALSRPNVIDPIQLLNWVAYCHYRKGEMPQAEKAWLKALDVHESDQVRLNLALVYMEANQLALARTSLLKALELNPKLLGAHFALGEIYYRSKKMGQARKHFTEVIHLEPLSEQAKLSQEILKKMSAKK